MRMWFVLGSYLYKMYVNLQTPLWLTNLTKAAKGIQTFSPRPKTVLQKGLRSAGGSKSKVAKVGPSRARVKSTKARRLLMSTPVLK